MPGSYALPTSASAPNPWINYFNSLPELSQHALDESPSSTNDVFSSVSSNGKGRSYNSWLSAFMPKYQRDYQASMFQNPLQHYVEYLGGVNPNDDYDYSSNFDKGLPAVGMSAPTMRMTWG